MVDGTDNDITNAIIHLNQLSSGHVHVEDLILNELPDSHQKDDVTYYTRDTSTT